MRDLQAAIHRSAEEMEKTGITAAELTRAVLHLAGTGRAKALLDALPPADVSELARSPEAREFHATAAKYLRAVSWARLILSEWVATGETPGPPAIADTLAGYDFPMAIDDGLLRIGTRGRTKAERRAMMRAALVEYGRGVGIPGVEPWADSYMADRENHGFQTLRECVFARRVLEEAGAVSKSANPN